MDRKKPLYRKVNTRTHGVRHGDGGKASWDRNTKSALTNQSFNGPMKSNHRHGLDYTPLFKFLLSKVGDNWDQVFSQVKLRVDSTEPVFWMVTLKGSTKRPFVRLGESSYYSGLYVDENGVLLKVDPNLTHASLEPFCPCCTHTFNGERFIRKYAPQCVPMAEREQP